MTQRWKRIFLLGIVAAAVIGCLAEVMVIEPIRCYTGRNCLWIDDIHLLKR